MDEESRNRNTNKKHCEYDEYNDNNSDNENFYLNDREEEKIEEEYLADTILIIQKNLINFVEEKSLPLCEYLSLDSIEKFLNDNIEY